MISRIHCGRGRLPTTKVGKAGETGGVMAMSGDDTFRSAGTVPKRILGTLSGDLGGVERRDSDGGQGEREAAEDHEGDQKPDESEADPLEPTRTFQVASLGRIALCVTFR